MITLKDMINLRPYCQVVVNNHKEIDFIDTCKHPENYIVSDMRVNGGKLEVLVNMKGELTWKFRENGFVGLQLREG